MNRALLSSERMDWATPREVFEPLDAQYGFETDVCATAENAKCVHFYSPDMDGLAQDWRGTCWMNPPYGREIGKWMKKAYESSQKGATVVCLVPSCTDTEWWHEYAMKGQITFMRGRVKFVGAKDSAPFPTAIVVFKPGSERQLRTGTIKREEKQP
ncbi:MAG: DNA N-6-adenine-methyltransferase [Anaerolineaceae bacterium]|nr:DNA N-6-adenine-methyltransferase [Anaerolineaceae bacterium]